MQTILRLVFAIATFVAALPAGAFTAFATFTPCASEGGTCSFSGTREVQFGTFDANAQFVSRRFSGTAPCSIQAFGRDPKKGVAKSCRYSSISTASGSTDQGSGQAPAPGSLTGLRASGLITATIGMVIEGVRIQTDYGPCIRVPNNVTNVVIRNSEIGPCGKLQQTINNEGVQILPGASGITVQRNIIHDVSTALMANGAMHPIVFDRNFVYNIRGPMWQGQMVQFGGVRGGSGSSKITCNVKDGLDPFPMAAGTQQNEDHISMYNTLGVSNAEPIEIAYNRIRGNRNGSSQSGSGMMLGDSPAGGGGSGSAESGFYWVHHNTIVLTNGVGIGVAGGHDIRIENNRVDNRGTSKADNTGWSFAIRRFDTSSTGICKNVFFSGNSSTIARLWAFNNDGSPGLGIIDGGGCSFSASGNNFDDSSLNSKTSDQIWNESVYTECGGSAAGGGSSTTAPPPSFAKTQIYQMATTSVSGALGRNITLQLRFFGKPMPTDVKPFIHLFNLNDDTYRGELINHYGTLGANAWANQNYGYDFQTNIGTDLPKGTFRISLGLYKSTPGYDPYTSLTECNGTALIVNPSNNSGCYIGTITIGDPVPPAQTNLSGLTGSQYTTPSYPWQ